MTSSEIDRRRKAKSKRKWVSGEEQFNGMKLGKKIKRGEREKIEKEKRKINKVKKSCNSN